MPSTPIIESVTIDAEEDGLRVTLVDVQTPADDFLVDWPDSLRGDAEPDYDELTSALADAVHLALHTRGWIPVSPTELRRLLYRVVAPGPGSVPGSGHPAEPVFQVVATEPLPHPLQEQAMNAVTFADRTGWAAYSGVVDDGEAVVIVLRGEKALRYREALLAIVDLAMNEGRTR